MMVPGNIGRMFSTLAAPPSASATRWAASTICGTSRPQYAQAVPDDRESSAKLGLVEPLPYDAFGVAALNLVTVRDGGRRQPEPPPTSRSTVSRAVVVAEVGTAAAVPLVIASSPRRRYQLGPGTRYPFTRRCGPVIIGDAGFDRRVDDESTRRSSRAITPCSAAMLTFREMRCFLTSSRSLAPYSARASISSLRLGDRVIPAEVPWGVPQAVMPPKAR